MTARCDPCNRSLSSILKVKFSSQLYTVEIKANKRSHTKMIIKEEDICVDRKASRRERIRNMCFDIQRDNPEASLDLILSAVLTARGSDRRRLAEQIVRDHLRAGASNRVSGYIPPEKGVLERLFEASYTELEEFEEFTHADTDGSNTFESPSADRVPWSSEKLQAMEELKELFPTESEAVLRGVLVDKKFNMDNAMEELFYRVNVHEPQDEELMIRDPIYQFRIQEDNMPNEKDKDDDENEEEDEEEIVLELSTDEYKSFMTDNVPLVQVMHDLQQENDQDLARRLQMEELDRIDCGVRRRILQKYRNTKNK